MRPKVLKQFRLQLNNSRILNISRLLFLAVFVSANLITFVNVSAQTKYFPTKSNWETKNALSVGMDADKVAAAVEFAKANEYPGDKDMRINILKGFYREPINTIVGPTKDRGGPAGMIIKNGYVVAQWGDIDRVDMTFSVTKSYLSTTAGLAYDEGLIPDLNAKVKDHIWDGTFDGKHNGKITWEHLLNQSSDWSGQLGDKPDWMDRPPRRGGIDDWKARKLNEPGTVMKYNDVRVNILAYSLLNVWRRPLPQVLKEKIMDPIGASTTWRWYGYSNTWYNIDGVKMQSVSGGGHRGGGMFISTMDHAKFGYLYLRNGNWDGKQLISEDWIKKLRVSSPANASYGYMWWLNRGNRKWDGVSESVFYAAGFGGNYIVVDQENDLLIVARWLPKMGEMVKMVTEAIK